MEQITHGVTREYTDNNQIVIFRATSLNVSSLQKWNDAIASTILNWPEDAQMYLSIYDFSHGGVSMPFLVLNQYKIYNLGVSPTGRNAVDNALAQRPELKIYLGLIFSDSLSGHITIKRGIEDTEHIDRFNYQVFFDEPTTLSWLRGFMTSPPS